MSGGLFSLAFWREMARKSRRGRDVHTITLTCEAIRGGAVLKWPPANGRAFLASTTRATSLAERRRLAARFVEQHELPTPLEWVAPYHVRLVEATPETQDGVARGLERAVRELLEEEKS